VRREGVRVTGYVRGEAQPKFGRRGAALIFALSSATGLIKALKAPRHGRFVDCC